MISLHVATHKEPSQFNIDESIEDPHMTVTATMNCICKCQHILTTQHPYVENHPLTKTLASFITL